MQKKYSRYTDYLLILPLVVIIFTTYSNTLNSPFTFDDTQNIQLNNAIRISDLSFKSIIKAGFDSPLSRPVAYISFAMNYYFHGYNLVGYHITNILIHLLTSIFLFFIFKKTLIIAGFSNPNTNPNTASIIAVLSVLVWSIHPLHTQSITYIVQRMNSLSAMFYVLSFLLYIKGRMYHYSDNNTTLLQHVSNNSPNFPHYSLLLYSFSFIAGLLAICTKEIAATLPLFIFLYEWYFFRNLDWNWLKRISVYIIIIGFLFVFLIYFFIGNRIINAILHNYKGFAFDLPQRVMSEFRVIILYITLIVFPHPSRLTLDYDFLFSKSITTPITTLISLLALMGIIALALYSANKNKLLSFSILWFIGNLLIESSVFALCLVFEHRTYLPSMMPLFMVVALVYQKMESKKLGVGITIGIAIVFAIWTYQRNGVWQNEALLWKDNAKKAPQNGRAYYNAALALTANGQINEAVNYYKLALKFNYYPAQTLTNLGITFYNKGNITKAIEHYNKALRINPKLPEAYNALGNAYYLKGEYENAIHSYQSAIKFNPDYSEAYNNIGLVFFAQQKFDSAIKNYFNALKINSQYADAYTNLGAALFRKGIIDKAIVAFKEALRLTPHSAEGHYNLGVAYYQSGDHKKAVFHFSEALRINPRHKQASESLKIIHKQ